MSKSFWGRPDLGKEEEGKNRSREQDNYSMLRRENEDDHHDERVKVRYTQKEILRLNDLYERGSI